MLVPMLLDKGYSVKAIDRFFFGKDLLDETANLEIIQEDSRHIAKDAFDDVDYVIDLVAVSNDPSGELFQQATWQINHESRVRTATFAKSSGVKRYILPSSCSIYGFQDEGVVCGERDTINPLTTYAKANRAAEEGVLPLNDEDFAVTVLRQATVYGYSPRMRFDLAINGMTYGAWKTKKLPLMRDGKQWRPMLHVKDAARAQIFLLEHSNKREIAGQIFNIGSEKNSFQIGNLAELVRDTLPINIEIEWYGDTDNRSYRVNFDKIEALGWKANHHAKEACLEIYDKLESGELKREERTITLDWYRDLDKWQRIINETEMYGGMLEI